MTMRLVSNSHSLELQQFQGGAAPRALEQRNTLRIPTHRLTYRVVKSAMDLSLATAIFPIAFVLGLGIAVLVKISSPGPVFFRHRRIGAGLRPFLLWKFRTMFHESDHSLSLHLASNPDAYQEWARHQKLRHDPRVTPIGRFLRRTHLDELPQLLNVLAGEMSLVGPRPVIEEELKRYGAGDRLYAAAKPGMTGLWQVSGRASLPYERRVALDIEYVATCSVLGDLRMLMRTFGAICDARGVY
jgi:lipopolysaccharide/colanic/teichoic acid biosynthesis glycosyltransferase